LRDRLRRILERCNDCLLKSWYLQFEDILENIARTERFMVGPDADGQAQNEQAVAIAA
jgi:hypothetical protein